MTQSHPARKIQFVALGFVMVASLVAVATMFVPMEQWDVNESGFNSKGTADVWGYHWRGNDLSHDRDSFFDNREDFASSDQKEISALRFAALSMLAGTALLVGGAATIMMDHKVRAATTALVGAALILTATMVHHQNFLDFANFHVDVAFGYYMGLAAGFIGLAGSLLAFIPHPGLGIKETFANWNKA